LRNESIIHDFNNDLLKANYVMKYQYKLEDNASHSSWHTIMPNVKW